MGADVLQEMNETQVTDVLMTLGRDFPDSIHMSFFIINFITWNETSDAFDFHFYCPDGDPRDGSVFAIARFKNGPTFVTFHSADLRFGFIRDQLRDAKFIPWSEEITFEGIHEKFIPLLTALIDEKNVTITKNDLVWQVYLKPEKRTNMVVLVPDPLYIAPMRRREFTYIRKYWEYYNSETESIVNATLEHNCAIGLYHRANDSLMGWAVEQHFGGIGMLHVLQEYRNQGYGAILIQAMAQRMIYRQIDPYAFIHISNNISYKLFKKAGFSDVCQARWITTTKG